MAGDPFDPELAAAAAGIAPDAAALDELCARDLIRPTGNGRLFGFRHLLLRHCVYDTIPPARRLDAHERAAAALAARGAGLAAQAYHVERCGRAGDPAATALLRDAAAAVARTAPATAARWYEAALRLLGDEPSVRAELLAPMGLVLAAAGRFEAAREALDEAYALAPSVEVAVACARVDSELGRYADARRRLQPEQHRPQVALELAAIAFHEGVLSDLATWAEPARRATAPRPAARPTTRNGPRRARPRLAPAARPAAPERPVPHAAALALCALGAAWTDEPDRAVALLEQATATLDAALDTQLATDPSAALYVATAQLLLVRLADCERTIERVLALGDERLHRASPAHRARWPASSAARSTTRSRTSTPARSSRAWRRPPRPLHFALWLRALVEHERGNADASARARARVRGAHPDDVRGQARAHRREHRRRPGRRRGSAPGHARRHRARGRDGRHRRPRMVGLAAAAPRARGARGRGTGPRAAVGAARERPRAAPARAIARAQVRRGRARAGRSRQGRATRERRRTTAGTPRAAADGALSRSGRIRCCHTRAGTPRAAADGALSAAGVATRAGTPRAAADGALSAARLAASAATIADDVGAVLDALDARLLEARALAAAGRTDAAKDVLQRITVDAAHRRAFRLRDAAARELRALGTRVASPGQRASGGALTDREREITALVAAGRSNRQVAETLFLSEKTVANALTRIYAKVGVRTRAQLARSHAV